MSVSAAVAALEARLVRAEAEIQVLRQYVGEDDEAAIDLMLAYELTRQQGIVLAALLSARPEPVDRYTLGAAMPTRDPDSYRSSKAVDTIICTLRRQLGIEAWAIETVRGRGWRISPDWAPAKRRRRA